MKTTQQITGQRAEAIACHYLESQGLRLIEKNFTCPHGEIDLIMEDQEDLVFVEVRFRFQIAFGSAAETIQSHKQHCLIQSAYYYLQTQGLDAVKDSRFDVIALNQSDHPHWIKDAFQVQDW